MIRTIIERLSRNKIIKRKLPGEFSNVKIFVSPDAQLKYMKIGNNAFDSDLLWIATENISYESIVWDIGANCGVFTLACASIATSGKVLAVEADIWLANLIRKSVNIKQNLYLNIDVLPAVISEKNGMSKFSIAKRGRASNSLESAGGRSQMGGIREEVMVPTLTLDTLLKSYSAPDFIKIDVEGAELQVLLGAKEILTQIRPKIYIEVGKDNEKITEIFKNEKYYLYDGSIHKDKRKRLNKCIRNTLAIPSETI